MLLVDLIQANLRTHHLGREITYYPVTDSTNGDLLSLFEAGKTKIGQVVITDEQRSGKGRQGRLWFAAPELGLPFSVLLYPEIPIERLGLISLGMGVAVVDALASEGVKALLKWPNDIVYEGHKLGGILAESRVTDRGPAIVIGVGINVNEQIIDFPEELHPIAVSLSMVLGKPVQREVLLAGILNRFEVLLESELDDIGYLWERRCCHMDHSVRFHGSESLLEGRFTGISTAGQGLIEVGKEIRAFAAGDLDLKPD